MVGRNACDDRVNAGESAFFVEKGVRLSALSRELSGGGFLEKGVRSTGAELVLAGMDLAGADLIVVEAAVWRSIGGVWERLRDAVAIVDVLWSRSKMVMMIFMIGEYVVVLGE